MHTCALRTHRLHWITTQHRRRMVGLCHHGEKRWRVLWCRRVRMFRFIWMSKMSEKATTNWATLFYLLAGTALFFSNFNNNYNDECINNIAHQFASVALANFNLFFLFLFARQKLFHLRYATFGEKLRVIFLLFRSFTFFVWSLRYEIAVSTNTPTHHELSLLQTFKAYIYICRIFQWLYYWIEVIFFSASLDVTVGIAVAVAAFVVVVVVEVVISKLLRTAIWLLLLLMCAVEWDWPLFLPRVLYTRSQTI